MQRDVAHLSELIHLIYSAALHPEQWNNVMTGIAASFGSTQGLLLTPYVGPQHGGLVFPAGLTEANLQLWATRYIDKNVWAIGMKERGLWRDGHVYTGDDMVSREVFLASPIYREFFSPQGIGQVCAGIVFEGAIDLPATALSVFRSVSDQAFDQEDVRWMKLLIPHVSRSMGIMMRLNTARVQNAALLASFDRLNFGVALLNEKMQVLHLNQPAKNVLAREDGLSLNARHQLEGCTSKTESKMQNISSWLEQVRNTPLSEQPHFLQGAVVKRKNLHTGTERRLKERSKKYYDLQCVPLPKTDAWFAQQQDARYVVFITDPQAVKLPRDERLCELYGMTSAQAKVTREFTRGATYKMVAENLRISEETVRTHIKEIYRKTHVNRQADLVHLILSISQSGV